MGFPGGSDGKESACKVGDPGSIPGLGRSPGEGNVIKCQERYHQGISAFVSRVYSHKPMLTGWFWQIRL